MPNTWAQRVRDSKQLALYPGPALRGGLWSVTFATCLREFNALSRRHALGVTLVRSDTPPAARGEGGADVAVEAGSDHVSCTYEGASQSESFNGSGLHGRTFHLQIDQVIEKAFVFLPAEPKINTPSGQRRVGEGVMKVILVHELIHACGLTNADHCSDDLFNGFPSVDYGSRPAADRVVIASGGRRRSMAPLFLAGPTIRNIRSVWT